MGPRELRMKCGEGSTVHLVGLYGLGVTCSPRGPRFVGSNQTEVDGYFQNVKNPEHKTSRRDFKLGGPESEISGSLKNLKPKKIGI